MQPGYTLRVRDKDHLTQGMAGVRFRRAAACPLTLSSRAGEDTMRPGDSDTINNFYQVAKLYKEQTAEQA